MAGFLKGTAKVVFFGLLGMAGYYLLSDAKPVTVAWVVGCIVLFAVTYEIGKLKDRIDTLQWTVDDLKREHYRDYQ